MIYKYICFDDDSFVVFGSFQQHTDFCNVSCSHKPISAGFCIVNGEKLLPYGESISLNLKSGPDDERRLNGRRT